MSNRKVEHNKKRIQISLTIQRDIKKRGTDQAVTKELSFSAYIENLIIKDLKNVL